MAMRKNGRTIDASWFNSIEEKIDQSEKPYDISNNQPATPLEGQSFDGSKISSVIFEYEVQGATLFANGRAAMQYLDGTWRVVDLGAGGEDHGVDFDVDQDEGGTIGTLTAADPEGLGDRTLKIKRSSFNA